MPVNAKVIAHNQANQLLLQSAKTNLEHFKLGKGCKGDRGESATARLAVFGAPIEQSKSPTIHHMFAEQFGISIVYDKILGKSGQFQSQLNEFFAQDGAVGANITMPFKEEAADWAIFHSQGVAQASAANTLVKVDGGYYAQTTDGKGLVADLLRNGMPIRGASLLIIGAGGAARGAISALLDEQPQRIYITNRTVANASRLVELANDERVVAIAEDNCASHHFDIIINATSLSLNGALPNLPDSIYGATTAVYDMVYQSNDTVFIEHAKSLGCEKVSDGLGMLVGQAAESFYLWFSVRPDVEPVLIFLRKELADL